MGVVYRARQVSLNRPVALKMIKAGVLAGEDELRRFQNEAEAVALLDHPGIVPVYEVGEHDGQRYFSMKLVDGGSLADRLDEFTGRPEGRRRAWWPRRPRRSHHAHLRGHPPPRPQAGQHPGRRPRATPTSPTSAWPSGSRPTPSMTALRRHPRHAGVHGPRAGRAAAAGSITTATDVYGLGAVLYALLTGRPPFARRQRGGHSDAGPRAASRAARASSTPTCPRDLETICLKCLEKDPRRRYASAQALADDLARWLENRPISARPVGAR